MMIPLGIPDFLCRIRYLEETSAVEMRGRAWAGGLRIDSVEVSLDGGNNWSFAKFHKPIGKWARVDWSITWEDVTPGQYTLRCRAKDERGNMSKGDDAEHDYYAMDITKAQYVDVNVYPKGTLTSIVKLLTLFGGCEDWSLWRLRRGTRATGIRSRSSGTRVAVSPFRAEPARR
jgi:hypothetical protein